MIIFDTIGVFLNQIRISNDNRAKVVWDINLRAFSVLATTMLSACIFKSLMTGDDHEINTVDDLVKSNLNIYAPNYLRFQETWVYMRC